MDKRKLLISVFLISLLLLTITKQTTMLEPENTLVKSTWIWNTSLIKTHTIEILSFAEQRKITEFYLQMDDKLASSAYQKFIELAHNQDVRVYAVGGDPSWALKSEIKVPHQFINWVNDFNQSAQDNQRFDGIQFDIEPYLLPEWSVNQKDIVHEWMFVLNELFDEANKGNLMVSGVIPFWLGEIQLDTQGGIDNSKTLSEWMIHRFDQVVLMAYRDQAEGPNGIIILSETELSYANKVKKPIMIAVETMDTPEGEQITFYHKGLKKMEDELAKVYSHFSSNSYFRGIAIHYYESYRDIT